MSSSSKELKPKNGLSFFYAISEKNLFRLAVDGHMQKSQNGYSGWETREPGSVGNFLSAIPEGFQTLQSHYPSVEFYKSIHKTCRGSIKTLVDVPGGEFIDSKQHGFPIYQLSLEGIEELCQFAKAYPSLNVSFFNPMLKKKDDEDYSQYKAINHSNMYRLFFQLRGSPESASSFITLFYMDDVSKKQSDRIATKIFEQFHSSILKAKTDDVIIQAIVNCIYDLEHLHPFKDVNLRSSIVLANILLMQQGFPPVCYEDPNLLDGGSKEYFFDVIKKGMLKTLDIIEKPEADHFGIKVSDIVPKPAEMKSYMESVEKIKKDQPKDHAITSQDLANMKVRIHSLKKLTQKTEWVLHPDHKVAFNAEVSSKQPTFDQTRLKSPILLSPTDNFELLRESFRDFKVKSPVKSPTTSINKNPTFSGDLKEQPQPKAATFFAVKKEEDIPSVGDEDYNDAESNEDLGAEMVDIFSEAIQGFIEEQLSQDELFIKIRELGNPHTLISNSELNLLKIAEQANLPPAVIARLKAIPKDEEVDHRLTSNKKGK